jgi:hypothetical protein
MITVLIWKRACINLQLTTQLFIEIPLPRQESEQTCIRVLRVPVLEVIRQCGTVFFFVLFCVNITFLERSL